MAHLVVEHLGQRPTQGGHNPAPLRGALPPLPLLPQVVGHELVGGRVVVHYGGPVLAEGVYNLVHDFCGVSSVFMAIRRVGGTHMSVIGGYPIYVIRNI